MLDGRKPIDPAPYLNGVPAKVLATLPGRRHAYNKR
jgi:hypothetical protein